MKNKEFQTVEVNVETFPHDPNENLRDEKFICEAIRELVKKEDWPAIKDVCLAHTEAYNLKKKK